MVELVYVASGVSVGGVSVEVAEVDVEVLSWR
jgi:hypothetical protein